MSLPLAGKKQEFPHVTSKVKAYIDDVKKISGGTKAKSRSMSNLAMESDVGNGALGNFNRMKAFLSTSNLADMSITVSGKERKRISSMDRIDTSRISRLLDKLSDDDGDGNDETDKGQEEVTIEVEVEDVLALAIEERREKKEAKKVLSQLQENYDELQRKFADAENKIDKLR